MAKHWLDITDDGDETVYIHFDGQLLIEVDHDRYGWDGMQGVIDAVSKMAEELGVEVNRAQDVV